MVEGVIALILSAFVLVLDLFVVAALLWPCYALALALERKLYQKGLRHGPPNGKSGIAAFAALLLALPALIVLVAHLTGRLPP